MKIAIVVGHNERSQGAVRVLDGRTEYDWNGEMAEYIHSLDPSNTKVFYRTPQGGYSAEIDRVYSEVDEWGADCSVELHFNGVANSSVRGCETLSSGTRGSRTLAKKVQSGMLKALPTRDRGVKNLSRGDRGGRSLWAGKAPAIMTEPYFGSNRKDCQIADSNFKQLAKNILAACYKWYEEK